MMGIMSISRRGFLGTAGAAGLLGGAVEANGTPGPSGMPTRILGKTGARVSILGMGGGSRFLMYKEEEKGLAALNHALDLGITYVDSAYTYGNGESETRVGKVMKQRRKGVFLVTKIHKRDGDGALRILEGSLKRLQTDHLDLIHVHGLMGADDLARAEAKDGVINALLKLRDQKVTRFIGVTCHHDPMVLKSALEHHDFDCTQMALNAAQVGESKGVPGSFETIALPVALKKKMGVTAMKIFSQDKIVGEAPPEKLIQYVLSLPVACAVIGMPKIEFLEANIATAKAFRPMPPTEMRRLSTDLAAKHKASLDHFFAHHIDA